MVVQDTKREAGSGARTNSRQAGPRTDAGSRSSTATSVASISGRGRSPGPSRTADGRSLASAAGGSRAAGAAGAAAAMQPRPSRHNTAAAPGTGTAPYRYLVLPGNESVLLREALERRPWWEPVAAAAAPPPPPPAGAVSLRKDKNKDGAGLAQQQQQQQQQRWNLWAGLNGQRFTQFELLQPGGAGGPEGASRTDPPTLRRLVNRLQDHRVICTKSGLAAVLESIKAAMTAGGGGGAVAGGAAAEGGASGASAGPASSEAGIEPTRSRSQLDLSWIPETYVVPAGPKAAAAGGGGGGALARFKAAFARHAAAGRRVWIAKPTSLNRGNGIEVYDSLDRILEHIKGRPAGSNLILQKYIERPLLLGGRKFDIRAYVLVGPDGAVWFHKEAYCRTSSTPYDSSDLANRSAHLTNDAVQKHLDTYHAFEDHCKMSLQELGPALRRAAATTSTAAAAAAHPAAPSPTAASPASSSAVTDPASASASASASAGALTAASLSPEDDGGGGGDSCALSSLDTSPGSETGLWGRMRRCVAALFSVAGPLLNPRRLGHCFELLGLDFMMDAEGGLYLIEVNTSPALFRAGSYLSDLLPRLVEEVVQKVVDPIFPQPPPPPPPPPSGAPPAPAPAPSASQLPAAQLAGTAATAEATDGAAASTAWPLLDGFVRVELDEQLAAAAAAAARGKGSTAARAASPGPLGARAAAGPAAAAAGGKGRGPGSRPAAVAVVAMGGGVRVARLTSKK
ncbi:hypothetical protein PLESTF_001539000 [Pleodorina starrii]|nr:hypothetical protein PLESTF_001539000 [Pleodorina starrii]